MLTARNTHLHLTVQEFQWSQKLCKVEHEKLWRVSMDPQSAQRNPSFILKLAQSAKIFYKLASVKSFYKIAQRRRPDISRMQDSEKPHICQPQRLDTWIINYFSTSHQEKSQLQRILRSKPLGIVQISEHQSIMKAYEIAILRNRPSMKQLSTQTSFSRTCFRQATF